MSIAVITPARIGANQLNARKSSGPKTLEGKARSRGNAVKHGLSGAGIALPTEDAAEVEHRFAALQSEMGASTALGSILVKQVALMSVRLDRAALQESAALTTRVRHAEGDFDQARRAEVDQLFEEIEADPANNHRRLLTFPDGVDRLIEALEGVKRDLDGKSSLHWDESHASKVEALFGRRATNFPLSRSAALFIALSGQFTTGRPTAPTYDSERAERIRWVRDQLSTMIGHEMTRLRAIRAEIDLEAIDLDRAEAPRRALFDPSPEATLARRYETEARRGLFRSLQEFRQAEAQPEPPTELAGTLQLFETETEPEAAPEPVERNEPNADDAPTLQATPDPNPSQTPTRNEPIPTPVEPDTTPQTHPEPRVRAVGDDSPARSIDGPPPRN